MMRTYSAKPADIQRQWWLVDVAQTKLPLGRLASKIAIILKGKHKAMYTPGMNTGDAVVIVNAGKIAVTGEKEDTKQYYKHTGYVGGIKSTSLRKMKEDSPERVLELAIKGMLPKGPLGREMLRMLFIYAGSEHKHQAQQPQPPLAYLLED